MPSPAANRSQIQHAFCRGEGSGGVPGARNAVAHRRVVSPTNVQPPKSEARSPPLAEFFLTALHEHGKMSKDEVRLYIEQLFVPDISITARGGGRATYATE